MPANPLAPDIGLDAAQPVAGLNPLADPNAPPAPGPFKRGIRGAIAGTKSSLWGAGALAARGATAVLPAVAAPLTTGLEQAALENVAAQNEIAAAQSMRYEDVVADPSRAGEFIKWGLGTAIPSLALMFAGGVAGRGLGALAGRSMAPAAAATAKNVGMYTGAAGSDVAVETGSIFPEALKEGVENPGMRALVGGAAAGAVDFLVLPPALRALMPGRTALTRGAGVGGVLKSSASEIVKRAPVVAGLEAAQEASQSVIENIAAGKSLSDPAVISDIINSALIGGIAGGGLGGIAGGFHGVTAPVQETPPSTIREQPPEVNAPDLGTTPQIPEALGSTEPVQNLGSPEQVPSDPVALHAAATQAMAEVEAQTGAAQTAVADLVAQRKALDVESAKPVGERRIGKEIALEKRALTDKIKVAKAQVEDLGGQLHAARTAVAGLAAQLDPAAAAMAAQGVDIKPVPAAGTTPILSEKQGGISDKTPTTELKLAEFLGGVVKRWSMEAAGQDNLDEMTANNISPQDTAKQFWSDTFFKLPAQAQDKFTKMLKNNTGMEPGSVVSHNAATGESTVAKNWMDVADAVDLGTSADNLEGTERGFVALMHEANKRAGAFQDQEVTQRAIEGARVAAGGNEPQLAQTQQERVSNATLQDHIVSTIAAKKIPDAKKVEHATHIESAIAAITQESASVPENYRAEFVKKEVGKRVGFRLNADVKGDIVDHILKTQFSNGAVTSPAQMTLAEYTASKKGEYQTALTEATERAKTLAAAKKEPVPAIGGAGMIRSVRNDRHKAAVRERDRLMKMGEAGYYRDSHEYEVRSAINRGEAVPAEVRAGYPHLPQASHAALTQDGLKSKGAAENSATVQALDLTDQYQWKNVNDALEWMTDDRSHGDEYLAAAAREVFNAHGAGMYGKSKGVKNFVAEVTTLGREVELEENDGQDSRAALTQDEFDVLPEPAKFAAVGEFNRIQMARGTELRNRIREMLGDRPGLIMKTFMATPDSPIGSYTRVDTLKSVITMALNAKDGLSVAAHEGYHAAEDHVLTSAEVQIVTNALKEGRPLRNQLIARLQQYDRENGTQLTDEVSAIPAEARAYAYEFWKRGELTADGPLARTWQKLREFFERVANLVRGLGFKSMEDIFTALDRGQFAERESNSGGFSDGAVNSRSADYLQSPAFKKWFGDSKVVDAEGKPLVVYHGTVAEFNVFDSTETADGGLYFTSDPDHAVEYAEFKARQDDNARVLPVYLSMKKPSIIDAKLATYDESMARRIKRALAKPDADGVIVRNIDDLAYGTVTTMYIVRRPEQIKSAIGNVGTFDPNNPDIRFSIAALIPPELQTLYSRAAVLAERRIATQMAEGELERIQQGRVVTGLIEGANSQPWQQKLKEVGFMPEVLGTKGAMTRWWNDYMSTPNFISAFSKGFGNVYRVLNNHIRYRDGLVERMLKERIPDWYKASFADQDAATSALFKRTVGRYKVDSQEYRDLMLTLDDAQKNLFDQATQMVAGFLNAELATDTEDYKRYLTSPGTYDKWLADRTVQVQKLKDEGYVPLRRYGDHTVRIYKTITDKEGVTRPETVYLRMFRHEDQAVLMERLLRKEVEIQGLGYVVERGRKQKNARETTPSVQQFLDTLRRNGVEVTQAERERLVLTMTSAESMERNRLMHREGTLGFSEDGMRVLNEFGMNTASKIAYSKFASAIDATMEGLAVDTDVSTAGEAMIKIDYRKQNEDGEYEPIAEYKARNLWTVDGPMSGYYHDRAAKLSDAVLVPNHSGAWSQNLRSAAMIYFIGGSISSAVVNVMSIPMLLVPQLSMHTNYANGAATALGAWKSTWQHQAILRDITRLRNLNKDPKNDMPGIDNVPGLRAALIAAADKLQDTELHQIMGISQGQLFSQSRSVRRAMDVWMAPFRISEQTNRITSFIAAYKIASTDENFKQFDLATKELTGKVGVLKGQELFNFSRAMVDSTQNNYGLANRPGITNNPVGAMMFVFKSFPLFMIEAAALMYKANPKSAVYMLLGLTMMTGIQGLPFADTIMGLIDAISQHIFGSSFNVRRALRNMLKDASEAAIGLDLSEIAMRGMVNEILGVSMSSRIGTGDFMPGSRLGTADADKGRIISEFLGAPYAMVHDAISNIGGALSGIATGDWKQTTDALRAGGPIAVRNAIKGVEQLNTGYAADSKGRKILDVGTLSAIFQMGGLANAGVAKSYDWETINVQTKAYYQQASQEMQTQLVNAMRAGDTGKVQDINDMRNAWNRENPKMQIMPNAASIRRAIMLADMPMDRRSVMQWGRRIRGANFFQEMNTEQ